jgi:hypothetical protein
MLTREVTAELSCSVAPAGSEEYFFVDLHMFQICVSTGALRVAQDLQFTVLNHLIHKAKLRLIPCNNIVARMANIYDGYWIDNWSYWITVTVTLNYSVYTL